MNTGELQVLNHKVESARTRVSSLFAQCLEDIENTALTSGLSMRDIGVDITRYSSSGDSYIVELKIKL